MYMYIYVCIYVCDLLIKCATYYFKQKKLSILYPENRKCFIEIMYWIKKVNYSFSNDMKIENIYNCIVRTINQYKRTRQITHKTKSKLDY